MKKPVCLLVLVLGFSSFQTRAAAKVDFVKDIAPILEQRCLECHGPEKQKGKLRLDQKGVVFNRTDPIIVTGSPDKSELVRLISLPKGHDDIMPNKGEPLTKVQIDLIRDWITQGAEWQEGFVVGAAPAKAPGGNQAATDLRAAAAELRAAAARLESAAASLDGTTAPVAAAPVERKLTPEELAALAKAKEIEQKAIAEIEKTGVAVRPIAINVDWKEANFRTQGTNITDASLAQLPKLFTLVDLNLAGTKITDAGLANLKNLTNLATLHLENTAITDAGLPHLKQLTKLTYLNLYGTTVTDAGLEHLKGLKNLKKLYVWQTKVTEEGAKTLRAALPQIEISRGVELTLVKKEDPEAEKKAKEEAEKKETEKKAAEKKEAEKKAAAEKKEADEKKAAEEAAKKEAAKKAADEAAKKEADAKAAADKKAEEKKAEEKKP